MTMRWESSVYPRRWGGARCRALTRVPNTLLARLVGGDALEAQRALHGDAALSANGAVRAPTGAAPLSTVDRSENSPGHCR